MTARSGQSSVEWRVIEGDCREALLNLPAQSVQTCVTSPPYYGLRDYGHAGQIGLEPTPDEYVMSLVVLFDEVRRVLRDDGTLWLNLGDSYAGSWGAQSRGGPPSSSSTLRGNGHVGGGPKAKSLSTVQIAAHPKGQTNTGSIPPGADYKAKDLLGIPWMVAFALRADGWYLRSDIVWSKPNPMPESVTDRPTKAHEYLFLLTKGPRYFYDADAIREPSVDPVGKSSGSANRRSVWTVATQPYVGAHFATFPPKLIEPCILAGSREGDMVFDPFAGAGTTGVVALRRNRSFIGCELNPDYAEMARWRIRDDAPLLNVGAEAA